MFFKTVEKFAFEVNKIFQSMRLVKQLQQSFCLKAESRQLSLKDKRSMNSNQDSELSARLKTSTGMNP